MNIHNILEDSGVVELAPKSKNWSFIKYFLESYCEGSYFVTAIHSGIHRVDLNSFPGKENKFKDFALSSIP